MTNTTPKRRMLQSSSNNEYTRTKLLNRLGYFQNTPQHRSMRKAPFGNHPASVLGDAIPITIRLNDDTGDNHHHHEERTTTSSSPTCCVSDLAAFATPKKSNCTPTQATNTVRFHESVTVLSIPSRYQYSDRIKHCLWSNKRELTEMTERNVYEFNAEGWDWKNVVLETDMYLERSTGHRIHPCHVRVHPPPIEDANENDDSSSFPPLERRRSSSFG